MKKDSQTLKHQGELYRVFVEINELHKKFAKEKHLGEPARGLLEVLRTIAQTALDAHRSSGIIDVHVDVYTPTALPGWRVDDDGDIAPDDVIPGHGTTFGGEP